MPVLKSCNALLDLHKLMPCYRIPHTLCFVFIVFSERLCQPKCPLVLFVWHWVLILVALICDVCDRWWGVWSCSS